MPIHNYQAVLGGAGTLGGIAWTFADLIGDSDIGVWQDASDLTNQFQVSDGTGAAAVDSSIAYITDKGFDTYHAIQTTSTKEPILRENSGYYRWEFDGVDDHLLITPLIMAQPITLIVACRSNDLGGTKAIVGEDTFYLGMLSSGLFRFHAPSNKSSSGMWKETKLVVIAEFNGASSNAWANNTQILTNGNPGANGLTEAAIGAREDGSISWDGDIYQVFIINRLLTANERALAMTYGGQKMGIIL